MRSLLLTGLPSDFFHPLCFHPGIHLVMELMTYLESSRMFRSWVVCWVASKILSTADNSPRLLVELSQPPASQLASSIYQAQPAGPGLPSAEPSTPTVSIFYLSEVRADLSSVGG